MVMMVGKTTILFISLSILAVIEEGTGYCTYSCIRREKQLYYSEVGEEYNWTLFSCLFPNILFRSTGEMVECVERSGPFFLQHRVFDDTYRCARTTTTNAEGDHGIYYAKPYRNYNGTEPSLCEACRADDEWKIFFHYAAGTTRCRINELLDSIQNITCTLPTECEVKDPLREIPCPVEEPTEGYGTECGVCVVPYKVPYKKPYY